MILQTCSMTLNHMVMIHILAQKRLSFTFFNLWGKEQCFTCFHMWLSLTSIHLHVNYCFTSYDSLGNDSVFSNDSFIFHMRFLWTRLNYFQIIHLFPHVTLWKWFTLIFEWFIYFLHVIIKKKKNIIHSFLSKCLFLYIQMIRLVSHDSLTLHMIHF